MLTFPSKIRSEILPSEGRKAGMFPRVLIKLMYILLLFFCFENMSCVYFLHFFPHMNLMGLSYALCVEFPREIICYDDGISFLSDFFATLYNFLENNALIFKRNIIIVLGRLYAEISFS